VLGTKMGDTIGEWRSGLKNMADEAVAKYAPNEDYQKVMDNLDLSVGGTLGWTRFDNTDAYNKGYSAGENFSLMPDIPGIEMPEMTKANGHLAAIAANTSSQLDYFEENIKLWRDIAEKEAITNLTTPEVDLSGLAGNLTRIANMQELPDYSPDDMQSWRNAAESNTTNNSTTTKIRVEFGDINNNVSSEMDLSKIIDYIGEKVEEELFSAAEGVYA
jgi:hypothetical protein